jgi:hypothetical protein
VAEGVSGEHGPGALHDAQGLALRIPRGIRVEAEEAEAGVDAAAQGLQLDVVGIEGSGGVDAEALRCRECGLLGREDCVEDARINGRVRLHACELGSLRLHSRCSRRGEERSCQARVCEATGGCLCCRRVACSSGSTLC